MVNLFGGEPTVRNDLLEIIALGRKHGVEPHIDTNGLRLADEEYCRKLCEARVPLRFAFDGRSRDIYEKLRNNRAAYDKKMKALENLKKYSRRKHTIIACAAWGINDQYIGDLFQFCPRQPRPDLRPGHHPADGELGAGRVRRRPDTPRWKTSRRWSQAAVPGGGVEFIPAGMTYWLKAAPFFRDDPTPGFLFFAGVHPNCESMTFLISDGEAYRGINHYLNKPLPEAAKEFADSGREDRAEARSAGSQKAASSGWHGKLLCLAAIVPWLLRTIDMRRVFGPHLLPGMIRAAWRLVETPPHEAAHGAALAGDVSARGRAAVRGAALDRFRPPEELQGRHALRRRGNRPHRDSFPHCLWYPYRNAMLRKICGEVRRRRPPRIDFAQRQERSRKGTSPPENCKLLCNGGRSSSSADEGSRWRAEGCAWSRDSSLRSE